MPVLTATNLRHAYGDDLVLSNVSLSVEPGERVGLVGRNGQGKSTLLKILAGELPHDSGDVGVRRGARSAYLKQNPTLNLGHTVREEAESAFGEVGELHAELEGVFEQMAEAEGDTLEKLLHRQTELEKRIEAAGGYTHGHKVERVLHGLGFTDAQLALQTNHLSGGQKARLALGRLLLEEPDVLLLDEPTNHLDIAGRIWLERFLGDEFKGAVVLISHDRRLLDGVVDRILEVELARLYDYPGDYTAYRTQRAERKLTQAREYEKQQTRFKREEAYIRKYKAGQRAKQARGRESILERAKADQIERPMELAEMKLNLPKAERTGEVVISGRGLTKKYQREDGSDLVLFEELDVSVGRGERWGVVGPNGVGKTTLVRTLLSEIQPDAGALKLGTNVQIGYFRQTPPEADPEMPVVRYIQRRVAKENDGLQLSEYDARSLAAAFLFSQSDQEKPLGVLSGGERARADLAALLSSAKNLLVLDEPTNHLDIPSAERLEQALAIDGGYEGALLLISHDRAMLDACCDNLVVLEGGGKARVFTGTYSEYEAKYGAPGDNGPPATQAPKPEPNRTVTPPPTSSVAPKEKRKSRFSWMPTDQLEIRINELETDIAGMDQTLGGTEIWTNADKAQQLTDERSRLKAELDEAEEEWLGRAE
ncbi:MAG: ABC-F family ATP-binding cassette domain-containing protein [Planctomycetota bacterium]